MKSAARLQVIKDNWDAKKDELDAALVINRKIWTVLVAAVSDEASQLPLDVKRNILSLGVFIFNHTLDIQMQSEPNPARLQVLININRDISAGLRSRPPEEPAPTAA